MMTSAVQRFLSWRGMFMLICCTNVSRAILIASGMMAAVVQNARHGCVRIAAQQWLAEFFGNGASVCSIVQRRRDSHSERGKRSASSVSCRNGDQFRWCDAHAAV